VARLSGAKVRAGIDNGRGRFLTLRAPDRGFGAMHEAGYWLSVAALLGADPSAGWQPIMPVTGEDRTAALALLGEWQPSRNGGEPLVVLHPGAGAYSLARMWPVERFAEVARALVDTAGARIVLVGGPGEQTLTRRLAELVARPGRVLDLAGRSDVHQTAAIIEQCDLFLGNDSGPMHMAAAVRTPVVAVFGPSNQTAWGPYTPPGQQSQHTIVARELPCMPCFYRAHSLGLREGCGTRPCLTGLGSEQVLRACLQKLEGSRVT
jgi:heptosyltransferase-2